jgi:DNA-3-methyladenine glycosylase
VSRRADDKSAASGEIRARRSLHSSIGEPLGAAFYDRPAELVARELLGARLISEIGGVRCASEIVETEAYTGPEDEASHAAARTGRTARNAAMFGAPGTAYVYLIYGMHWCLNAVTGPEGHPAAVLIRAARPVEGVETMLERRGPRPEHELLRGPGNLARALGIDGAQNGHLLDRPPLWIAAGAPVPAAEVVRGPRVGIGRARELPLRFRVRGSRFASR